jgi:hypothetical protein
MNTASPRSSFELATWLWIATTLLVLVSGPLLLAHPRGPPVASNRLPPVLPRLHDTTIRPSDL